VSRPHIPKPERREDSAATVIASGSTGTDDTDDRKGSQDEQKQIVPEAGTRGSGAHQGRGDHRGGAQAGEDEGAGRGGQGAQGGRGCAEQRRRNGERDAKLRRSQEEKAEGEERLARDGAKRRWKASGGTEALFEQTWPSMWEEMLKERTVDADRGAREAMARSSVSRI
jgi:hypothetical protein